MSKKRHRDRRNDEDMQNNMGLNPQMMDMLKANNIDVSKFSEMMSAMNKDGFNINNLSSLLSGGNMGGGLQGGFPNMGNMPPGMAGLASMMQNMNRNNRGFMNNNQNGMYQNNMNPNNMNPNNMHQNNMHSNNMNNMQSKANIDENIEMLLSIKSVVNPQKAKFIDKVIEMYKNGEIKY